MLNSGRLLHEVELTCMLHAQQELSFIMGDTLYQ